MSRTRSTWMAAGLLFVACVLITVWASPPYLVGVFHDDGVYALLARSIATGQGFHYSHLPGAPAATHYPPAYPLLLAAVWRFAPEFPGNVRTLLAPNAVFIGLAAMGWWRFASLRLSWSNERAAVGAFVATIGTPVLALASALLSESLFLALVYPCLLLAERVVERGRAGDDRPSTLSSLVAGLSIGLLMLVRTHALALLIALLCLCALRRRWRAGAIAFAAAAAIQLPWIIWSAGATPKVVAPLQGAYGSYLGWFGVGVRQGGVGFVAQTVRANLSECWLLLNDRVAPGAPVLIRLPVMLAFAALLAWGAWIIAKRAPVTALFLALYVAIVLVWPYAPWRFLWAVWPLLAMCALEGVRNLWQRDSVSRWPLAVAATAIAWCALRTQLIEFRSREWRAPAARAAQGIAPSLRWVQQQTSASDVVLSEGEQIIALYADRKAAPPVEFTAREYLAPADSATTTTALRAMLAAVPARYVITVAPPVQRAAAGLGSAVLHEVAGAAPAIAYEVVK